MLRSLLRYYTKGFCHTLYVTLSVHTFLKVRKWKSYNVRKNTRPFIFTFYLHERMVFTKVVILYKNVYVHITMVSNTMPDFATMIENVNVEYFCNWADHISIINILHEICLLCKTKATPKDIQLRAIAFIKLRTKNIPSSKSDIWHLSGKPVRVECDVYFILATGILQE